MKHLDPVFGYVQARRDDHTRRSEPQSIALVVEMLDLFCARERIAPMLVKIAVKGYEGEVLAGCPLNRLHFPARPA